MSRQEKLIERKLEHDKRSRPKSARVPENARQGGTPVACWHCTGSGKCKCISCGKNGVVNDTLKFIEGPCQWCIGRALVEKHRAVYDKFDTLDRNTWQLHPAHDGSPVRREWLPLTYAIEREEK
jgi:hypothetical protein